MSVCPDCENTRAVRALALDDNLWTNLVTLALPVLIVVAISVLLYRRDAEPVAQPVSSKGAAHDT